VNHLPRCTAAPARWFHRHAVDIRPAGPDHGRHHDQWWIRDYGCDVTYLQAGPNPEPRTAAQPERTPS
jgi:hypothetical protein